jgi:hypothetical protein
MRLQRNSEKFREIEYSMKLERASKQQNRKFNNVIYAENNCVFYQDKLKKAWHGPVKVFCHRGENVWVWLNGDLKKIASCKIQSYKGGVEEEKDHEKEIQVENEEKKEDRLEKERLRKKFIQALE